MACSGSVPSSSRGVRSRGGQRGAGKGHGESAHTKTRPEAATVTAKIPALARNLAKRAWSENELQKSFLRLRRAQTRRDSRRGTGRGRGPRAAQHPRPAASFGQKESPARFLWCVSATRFHLPMQPVESWCGCARCAQKRSKQKTTRAQKGAPPQLQRHRKTWR